MKRLFKWIGFTLLGLLLLLATVLGVAYYYKSEIVAAVKQELKESVNGDFSIGDVSLSLWDDFPTLSITLRDIYIRGPQYNTYKTDFFSAKKVFVNVQLAPLLRKNLVVQSIHVTHGAIQVFRTISGYTNLDVFKKQESQDTAKVENPVLVFFKKVQFEDVKFSYRDSLKRKSFGFHFLKVESNNTQTDSSGLYALNGPMKFDGLEFNPDNGSFLKEKTVKVQFNLEFKPKTQNLVIHPSWMAFSKSKVDFSGDFYFAPPGKFVLKVGSAKLDYKEGISLLTRALQGKLEKFKIEKPVNVVTTVHGQFAPGSLPDVDLTFQFSKSKAKVYQIEVEQVTLDGLFSNHVDSTRVSDDHNSTIRLKSFEGIFQGLPTKLTATIRDLKDPILDLQSDIEADLRYFNTGMDTNTLQISRGKFISHVAYSGKLNEYLDSTKTKFSGKVAGTVAIQNGAFRYMPRNQRYENIQVRVDFVQDQCEGRS